MYRSYLNYLFWRLDALWDLNLSIASGAWLHSLSFYIPLGSSSPYHEYHRHPHHYIRSFCKINPLKLLLQWQFCSMRVLRSQWVCINIQTFPEKWHHYPCQWCRWQILQIAWSNPGVCPLRLLFVILGKIYNQQAALLTGSQWLGGFYQFKPSIGKALSQAFYDIYLIDISSSMRAYNAVLWTMNIEFEGSLLVFTLALFFGKLKNRYHLYILTLFLLWTRITWASF